MSIDPIAGALLVGWPFARLLIAHCVLPALALLVISATTVVVVVVAGVAGPGALALIPSLAVTLSGAAALCATLAARRWRPR
ncbi:MAG: hypothetical protein ACR2NR_01585 [Solirubrobacteraceae bacterium]